MLPIGYITAATMRAPGRFRADGPHGLGRRRWTTARTEWCTSERTGSWRRRPAKRRCAPVKGVGAPWTARPFRLFAAPRLL